MGINVNSWGSNAILVLFFLAFLTLIESRFNPESYVTSISPTTQVRTASR
jgi:hypothetical protein